MKITFGLRKLGAKPPEDDEAEGDELGEEGESKSIDELGEASAHVAMRAFCKALGVDPEGVDMKKAGKAFRALVATCKRSEDEDY